MLSLQQIRQEKYQYAPLDVADLYGSPDTGELLLKVAAKNSLPNEKFKTFGLTVGDVILGLLPREQLAEKLKTELLIPDIQAKTIVLDLKSLIEKIPDLNAWTTLKEKDQTRLAQADDSSEDTSTTNQAPKPDLISVAPFRTMETDVKKIHGYGAFRAQQPRPGEENIYKSEQAKLVPPPSYTDPSSTPQTHK
jgi:hypothetical protein